ncbi:MAG: hypothetical protein ACYC1Y_03105 [Minisyncoccota bacterium]
MPLSRSSAKRPEAMTWAKALPVIIAAVIFDLVRMFFEMFWFFGPAIAGLYCTTQATDFLSSWSFGFLGVKTAATVCSAAAVVGGAAISEFTTPFGVIMADAMGFAAFLILGLWILMTNARLFRVNATGSLWFLGGFGISEIPLVGTLPAFSVVLWRLYHTQIKKEGAARRAYEKALLAERNQERQLQAAALMQARSAETAQFQEQEAASDEQYAETENDEASLEAANDAAYEESGDEEIPGEVRKVA